MQEDEGHSINNIERSSRAIRASKLAGLSVNCNRGSMRAYPFGVASDRQPKRALQYQITNRRLNIKTQRRHTTPRVACRTKLWRHRMPALLERSTRRCSMQRGKFSFAAGRKQPRMRRIRRGIRSYSALCC